MAQTKQRTAPKRAGGSQKSKARSHSASTRAKSMASKRNASKPTNRSRSANGAKPVASKARRVSKAVANKASVMGKAKAPMLAGGAALVGAAGGLVMGTRHGRRSGRLSKALPQRPKIKVDSHDIAKAAKEVGNFGAQVGHLASELQRTRESANGEKHRSPVEVVLDGLTHRRSHS
jgi:hypothetical protein